MSGMCNAAPYAGQEKFVYVHHHKSDQNAAFTLIEKLTREGYRIWYAPTTADADMLSEQVNRCTVFMPLYSDEAVQSHNFRKVITAAVLSGKEIAPVFLEPVTLSPGMNAQFNGKKCVNWHSMWAQLDLKAGATLRSCMGSPNPAIVVQERSCKTSVVPVQEAPKRGQIAITTLEDEEEILKRLKREKEEREAVRKAEEADARKAEEEEAARKAAEEAARRAAEEEAARKAAEEEAARKAAEEAARKAAEEEAARRAAEEEATRKAAEEAARKAAEEEAARKAAEEAARKAAEEAARKAAEEEAARKAAEEADARRLISRTQPIIEEPTTRRRRQTQKNTVTVLEEDLDKQPAQRRSGTVIIEEMPPIVIRMKTGEVFEGRCGVTTVGRTEDNDVCIPADTVSGHHLEIISMPEEAGENRNLIKDCNSSNGTWIDGQRMERGGKIPVESCIRLSLSKPEPCFIVFGDLADQVRHKGILACLECRETQELKLLMKDRATFGRNHAWEKGAFDEAHISKDHAVFEREGDGFMITDISSNGTRINGKKIRKDEPTALASGDEIEMGRQHFVFTCIALKEK